MKRLVITSMSLGALIGIAAALLVVLLRPGNDGSMATSNAGAAAPTQACEPIDTPPGGEPGSFQVSVSGEQTALPAEFENQIALAAGRAYTQWRNWLGEDALVNSHINIRFIGDAGTFGDIYGKPNGEDWTATGFYRIRSNEALVLYTPAYQASALATAFHEMSHLITAWHVGPTPPWLNEGIAEYFETLDVDWQNPRFRGNPAHLELLRSEGPVAVDELTALTRGEWTAVDAERRYASAWALVAFMLDEAQGQVVMRRVLKRAHAGRCEPGTPLGDMLASYPGGLAALQRDWLRWLDQRYAERSAGPGVFATEP